MWFPHSFFWFFVFNRVLVFYIFYIVLFMFSGIVSGMATVTSLIDHDNVRTFVLTSSNGLFDGVQIGASVSVSGTCLTVVAHDQHNATFDVISESLDRTNLGALEFGNKVNIERSMSFGAEVGGHVMSGHVMTTAEIVSIVKNRWTFQIDPQYMKFIFQKGFIGLDGCSLTVISPDAKAGTFSVALIPETIEKTTFGKKQVGEKVNVEIDPMIQAVVSTVERYMEERSGEVTK
jgi:riboflavin synthase